MFRAEPYGHKPTFEVASGVVDGTLRLAIDESALVREARDGFFPRLMQDCWHASPKDRPDFTLMHARLSSYLEEVLEGADGNDLAAEASSRKTASARVDELPAGSDNYIEPVIN